MDDGVLEEALAARPGLRPPEYKPKFEFTGGRIVKVVFDVADDAYIDVERELAAAMARD
jgi:hypothetical protein